MEPLKTIEVNDYSVKIEKVGGGVYKVFVEKNGNEVSSKYLIYDFDGYEFIATPSYLDKPVLVKFDVPVIVGPKKEKKVYILLPIEVDIAAKKGHDEITIENIKPDNLKDAWFGELHEGAIYYYYESNVFGEPEAGKRRESEVFVPVIIKNRDHEQRKLEKLLIDSYQLSIYDVNGIWISEKVEVVVEDNEIIVYYSDEPPERGAREIKRGEVNIARKGLERLLRRNLGKIKTRIFNYG